MDTTRIREWYHNKVRISDEIVAAHGQEGEPDAEILLCCATSALASLMWPGENIDRRRLVEFLVQLADPALRVRKISVPLLANKLEDGGDRDSAIRLRARFLPAEYASVIDGDVDQDEAVIENALLALSKGQIRESSYAATIYTGVRCGLVHEYQLSSNLESWGVSERVDVPSYVNLRVLPDPGRVEAYARAQGIDLSGAMIALARPRRFLHFPYVYLRSVLTSAAESAFDCWNSSESWEQPIPSPWWIDG
jgi:hypothetical protein